MSYAQRVTKGTSTLSMRGDYSVTLSLAQAAELAGVSVSTLRRLMKQGQLEIEPRESSRSPIQVSTQALLKAGLELSPRLDLSPKAEGVESELRAEIERLKARELELLERASRAEGEAAALGALVPSLEQALKAVNSQLNSQRPVLEYSAGNQRRGLIERLRGRKKGSQGL